MADDALYFLIDLHRRVFGEVPMLRNFAPQENRFFLLAERQWSKLAHAPFANHVPSDVRRSLNIVASAGRNVAKEQFFGRAPAHQYGEHRFEVFLRVGMFVVRRQLHRQAQSHAAGNNGYLVNRIRARRLRRHQRMSRFVVRRVLFLFVGQNHRLAFDAHQDFILGHLEVHMHDEFSVLPRSPERRFVHQVCQVSTRKARRAARNNRELHVVGEGYFASMHAKNFLATLHVRSRHDDAAVESAGTQQSRIEHIGPVCGRDQNHAFVRFKPVHFDE